MDSPLHPSRREFLSRASGGFGALALAGLLGESQAAESDPLAPRAPHIGLGLSGAAGGGLYK